MLNFDLFSLIAYLVRFNAINKRHFLTYMLKCMSTSQLCHYSRAIWTSLYRFWPHVTWAPTFVKMCVEENLNSLQIMINGCNSPEISIMRPLKHIKHGFQRFSHGPYQDCASGPYQKGSQLPVHLSCTIFFSHVEDHRSKKKI